MKKDIQNLSRGEKILSFLYEFGNGNKIKARYEDIVVGVFKKYPHDFHLKGYPEFPDSGDLIHKPLYDFKKKGYMTAASKVFSLTDHGLELARQLSGTNQTDVGLSSERLSRTASIEVARIKNLEGFLLFLEGKLKDLTESDFYNYLGVTVRTQKNAFIGRFETIESVVNELKKKQNDPLYLKVLEYHQLLISKNQTVINYFLKN